MKKATKKVLMSLFIILIFGFSSIAFYASAVLKPQDQTQMTPLSSPVVEGNVDINLENAYLSAGFTWVKYYEQDMDTDPFFSSYINSLPTTYATPTSQPQIIVQKFKQAYFNNTRYIIISTSSDQRTIAEPTEQNITETLCAMLTVTPLECGLEGLLRNLVNSTESNKTS